MPEIRRARFPTLHSDFLLDKENRARVHSRHDEQGPCLALTEGDGMTTQVQSTDPNTRWCRMYPTLAPALAPPPSARLGFRTAALVDGNGRVIEVYLWTCLDMTWWRRRET